MQSTISAGEKGRYKGGGDEKWEWKTEENYIKTGKKVLKLHLFDYTIISIFKFMTETVYPGFSNNPN